MSTEASLPEMGWPEVVSTGVRAPSGRSAQIAT